MSGARTEPVEAFLRGAEWPAASGTPYPRADPSDGRLPADTRAAAQLPVGVRLELTGTATWVDVSYRCATPIWAIGAMVRTTFSVWQGGDQVDDPPAQLGERTVRLNLGRGREPTIVYLPEGMRPVVTNLRAVDGEIEPAPPAASLGCLWGLDHRGMGG
jgi:hypothetical protein